MISQVDDALKSLVRDALGKADVEVVFDAPTKDWAARRNAPTLNLYLYDLREDLRRRTRGQVEVRSEDGGTVVARIPPPRFFKLSYLVTAWTQRPEDEHRLLDSVLRHLVGFDALPPELVHGHLAEAGTDVPILVGLPPPEDRGFADVWSALGGELKPSLDVVVIAPLLTGMRWEAGPPVREGMQLDMANTQAEGSGDVGRHQHRPVDARPAADEEPAAGKGPRARVRRRR